MLLERGIKVSMDGKGRCIDNIFVERLWRSVKYEEVYLHAYANLSEARAGIGRYLAFYNSERPHQALGYQTPDEFYRTLQQAAWARPQRTHIERTSYESPPPDPHLEGPRDLKGDPDSGRLTRLAVEKRRR